MERNYQRTTMNMIADIHVGVRVDTQVVNCLTYLTAALHQPFNISGRVRINQFFIEAITAWGAQAGTINFLYDAIAPAVAEQDLSGASGAVTGLARGLRVVFRGGAVATAAAITSTAGVSDTVCNNDTAHVVGVRGGTGYLGYENSGAAVITGTMQVTICYAPMEDGAFVTANW